MMRVPNRYWFAPGLLCIGIVLAVAVRGCGTAEPTASGTILLDGNPLPMGSIRFVPVPGTPGPDAGTTISEGKYRVSKGLTEGEYRIEIQGTRTHPTRKVRVPFPTGMISDEVQVVPPDYNHESKLIRTVEPGENTFDFDLKGFSSG